MSLGHGLSLYRLAKYRTILGNKTRLKIGEFFRLMQKLKDSCKCPPPGYCFTIEHNKEFTPNDIEYCEQVEYMEENGLDTSFGV